MKLIEDHILIEDRIKERLSFGEKAKARAAAPGLKQETQVPSTASG